MSIVDILAGRVPIFKRKQKTFVGGGVERVFSGLINRDSPANYRYTPPPSGQVLNDVQIQQNTAPPIVSGRYTLNPSTRTKILDTGSEAWDVYITVPNPGQVCYVTHSGLRAVSTSAGLHEGIPLTNNPSVQGRPTPNHLKWRGEMWASGDTINMIIEVEAS